MEDKDRVALPELPVTMTDVLSNDAFQAAFQKIYPFLGLILCWIQRELVSKCETLEQKGMAVEVVRELDKILANLKPKGTPKKKQSTRPRLKKTN